MQTTTKNTTTQTTISSDYERALQRARKAGLRIVGQGRIKQDGTPFVAVSSSREPNRYYLVIIGKTCLACECAAGLRDKMCMHRALVHARLLQRWREERDRVERQVEADLRASLLELDQAHRVLDAAMRRPVLTMPGDAPTVSQREAAALLQPPRRPATLGNARVYRPDVARLDGAADVSPRLLDDTRPISIWK